MHYKLNSVEELIIIARDFLEKFSSYRYIALKGEMGAGKTTFVKAICNVLGVQDTVSSPTFSIVNEYTSARGNTLFHFDFYRIDDEQEALDFGIEEYFDSNALCLMEWSEKIQSLLPEDTLVVQITVGNKQQRSLSVLKPK